MNQPPSPKMRRRISTTSMLLPGLDGCPGGLGWPELELELELDDEEELEEDEDDVEFELEELDDDEELGMPGAPGWPC